MHCSLECNFVIFCRDFISFHKTWTKLCMFNHNKTCLLQALFYILCSNCVCVIGIEILNAIRFTTLHTNCLCSHATFKFSSKVYMAAHKRCFVFTSLCFCFLVGIERFFVFFFFLWINNYPNTLNLFNSPSRNVFKKFIPSHMLHMQRENLSSSFWLCYFIYNQSF